MDGVVRGGGSEGALVHEELQMRHRAAALVLHVHVDARPAQTVRSVVLCVKENLGLSGKITGPCVF